MPFRAGERVSFPAFAAGATYWLDDGEYTLKRFQDIRTKLLGELDDPAQIPEDRQRYDVGMILTGREDPCGLPVRTVAGGRWAVFEVPHTEEGVSDFWRDLPQRAARLPVDGTRPILERYAHPKVSAHICEFCVPCGKASSGGFDA